MANAITSSFAGAAGHVQPHIITVTCSAETQDAFKDERCKKCLIPASTTVKIFRTKEDISDIVKEAVANSGLRGKKKIFVKPNLSHPEYLPGVVTSPELMRQFVGLFETTTVKSSWANLTASITRAGLPSTKPARRAAVKAAGGTVINLSEDKAGRSKIPRRLSAQTSFFAQNHPRCGCRRGFAVDENPRVHGLQRRYREPLRLRSQQQTHLPSPLPARSHVPALYAFQTSVNDYGCQNRYRRQRTYQR